MKIRLVRIYGNDDETVGVLTIEQAEECFTLEDQYQLKKIYGETRIPEGTYKIGIRTTGRMHEKYKEKFSFHKGMLQLLNVPKFKFILIHIGNDDRDTSGCILVGKKTKMNNKRFKLENSTDAYKSFYNKVIDEAINGNLYIQIV